MRITPATTLAGVVGDPISHSLSPTLHNAAYAALGIDAVYLAFCVREGHLAAAVGGAAALGFRGLSVTMPHKEQAAAMADRRSPTSRRLRAANTLVFEKGEVIADSIDGEGLLRDLEEALEFDPAGSTCGVIGTGGAARAAVLALAGAGAKDVVVVGRTPERAAQAILVAPGIGRVGRPRELSSCGLVVQATSVGMEGTPEAGASPVDPGLVGAGQIVVDLVYEPRETPFLLGAARSGATTRNGLGTLVHQAALQVTRFTGETPPLAVMWESMA